MLQVCGAEETETMFKALKWFHEAASGCDLGWLIGMEATVPPAQAE